jgi:hypothetical protein
VQPCGCNPVPKKAAQARRQRSTGSDGNDEKEEKIFYGEVPPIDFRGHLAVPMATMKKKKKSSTERFRLLTSEAI